MRDSIDHLQNERLLIGGIAVGGISFSIVIFGIVQAALERFPQVIIPAFVSLSFLTVIILSWFGAKRGWTREVVVAFSVILALALNQLMRSYIPIVAELPSDSSSLFWIQTLILGALCFFGYQTVTLVPYLESRATGERRHRALFGAILGAINGYLTSGTLLYYIYQSNFQVLFAGTFPPIGPTLDAFRTLMRYMMPSLLGGAVIYVAAILSFILVIVVYSPNRFSAPFKH